MSLSPKLLLLPSLLVTGGAPLFAAKNSISAKPADDTADSAVFKITLR